MMNAGLNQGSAKIYQFPSGGRSALAGRRYGETRTVSELAASADIADCSGSWYHAAAIQNANNERDH
jgi:hypothetical protein